MDAEKIICCDNGRNNGLEMAALMNGGMGGGQWNNPFIYLVWMMFAQRMWGGNLENAAGLNPQYATLQNQMQDNQNANLIMDGIKGNASSIATLAQNLNCDFNTLQQCCYDVKNAITQVSGQVGYSAERVINAAQMGDCQIIQALKDCCCGTQQAIQRMGYEQQLATCHQTNTLTSEITRGFTGLNYAISQGFASTAYENQRQTCDLLRAGEINTQRIVDTLNQHWRDELQQKYNDARLELSQLRQNETLIAALKPTTATAGLMK